MLGKPFFFPPSAPPPFKNNQPKNPKVWSRNHITPAGLQRRLCKPQVCTRHGAKSFYGHGFNELVPFVYEETEARKVRNVVLGLLASSGPSLSFLLNSSPQPRPAPVQAPPRPALAAAGPAQPITRGARRCAWPCPPRPGLRSLIPPPPSADSVRHCEGSAAAPPWTGRAGVILGSAEGDPDCARRVRVSRAMEKQRAPRSLRSDGAGDSGMGGKMLGAQTGQDASARDEWDLGSWCPVPRWIISPRGFGDPHCPVKDAQD